MEFFENWFISIKKFTHPLTTSCIEDLHTYHIICSGAHHTIYTQFMAQATSKYSEIWKGTKFYYCDDLRHNSLMQSTNQCDLNGYWMKLFELFLIIFQKFIIFLAVKDIGLGMRAGCLLLLRAVFHALKTLRCCGSIIPASCNGLHFSLFIDLTMLFDSLPQF